MSYNESGCAIYSFKFRKIGGCWGQMKHHTPIWVRMKARDIECNYRRIRLSMGGWRVNQKLK
jgi:hypothetical protein